MAHTEQQQEQSTQKEQQKGQAWIKIPDWFAIDNYLENVKIWYKVQPFMYDKTGLYWLWDHDTYIWRQCDETDVMIALDRGLQMHGATVNKSIKANYLEAVRRIGRMYKPHDPRPTWVQFNDTVYDIKEGYSFKGHPNIFITNRIPWNAVKGSTERIEQIFRQWVAPDKVELLFDIIAYSCLCDMPIASIFCLKGGGSNGKSEYQRLIGRFLGEENICESELSLLSTSRFESSHLYRKLVCFMGEINCGTINETALLKKLSAGDFVGVEFKHRGKFVSRNYAKLIVGANSLPRTIDNTHGWHRRWYIIDFPNQFDQQRSPILDLQESDYEALAYKCLQNLKPIVTTCSFTNTQSIEQRQRHYEVASNPLKEFLDMEFCKVMLDSDYYSIYGEVYTCFTRWLVAHNKRKVKYAEFRDALTEEGLYIEKTQKGQVNGRFIIGLQFSFPLFEKYMHDRHDRMTNSQLTFPYRENKLETRHSVMSVMDSGAEKKPFDGQSFEWSDDWIVHHQCAYPGCITRVCNLGQDDLPFCKKHLK